MRWRRLAGKTFNPQIPDSPAGFLESGQGIRGRGFGPALLFEMLKIAQRHTKMIMSANGSPMLTMPKTVSAISESSVPLGCTLRTDMMPLPRAFRSSPQDEQKSSSG